MNSRERFNTVTTENTDSTEKREGGGLKSGPTQEYLPLIALGG